MIFFIIYLIGSGIIGYLLAKIENYLFPSTVVPLYVALPILAALCSLWFLLLKLIF